MNTRSLVHEEHFNHDQATVFALLLRPSAIRSWWGASTAIVMAEVGGTWAATWGDDEDAPDYISVATISELDAPTCLVLTDSRYVTKEGPLPFEASFETVFSCSATENGTVLRIEQSGFPEDQDQFYQSCVQGWRDTFAGIRRYLGSE